MAERRSVMCTAFIAVPCAVSVASVNPAENVAVTAAGPSATVQLGDAPPQLPFQLLKLAAAAGAPVSVTAFTVNVPEHTEAQLIPAGVLTTVPTPEPLTVTVSVNIWPVMVKVRAPDDPPPGGGLNTVTWADPAMAMSPAEMAARNSVPLTNVVVRFEPFQRILDDATKFVPLTVSVNPAPPAVALLGASAAGIGTGLVPVPISPRDTNTLPSPYVNLTFPVAIATAVGWKRAVTVLLAPAERL